MLIQDRIRINGVVCRIAAHPVQTDDTIEIGPRRYLPKLPRGWKSCFEDDVLLVVHKPSGLLTVATRMNGNRPRMLFTSIPSGVESQAVAVYRSQAG